MQNKKVSRSFRGSQGTVLCSDSGADAQNKKYQYVKLNNFKNYTIASGLAYIGVELSEADWEINSTTNLV